MRIPSSLTAVAMATAVIASVYADGRASDAPATPDSIVVLPSPAAGAAPAGLAGPPAPAVGIQRGPRSPLMVEIRAILDTERNLLRRLESEVKLAAGTDAALALQRQIAQVKQNTEIDLLRAQAKHARREGRLELAERIEADVREMLMTPEERAAAERARAAAPVVAPNRE